MKDVNGTEEINAVAEKEERDNKKDNFEMSE